MRMPLRGGLREGVARPETPPQRRRASLGPRLTVTVAGARIGFPFWEDRFLARPTCHRSPDEVIHELASQASAGHCRGEGRLQHGHRLSLRKRPPTSQPEENAPGTE